MDVPSRLRRYTCDDYYASDRATRGCWDEEAQLNVIVPAAEVQEYPDRGFLAVGRPGVDGIMFGYREGQTGLWAYYPIENAFVPVAGTLIDLVECWLAGRIKGVAPQERVMPMTESEWNSCTDPQPMLEFLRGKVSDRKLRLFACECYRHAYPEPSERQQEAPRSIELFINGKLSRRKARMLAIHPLDHFFSLFCDQVSTESLRTMLLILAGANSRYDPDNPIPFQEEQNEQCSMLRDFIPFRGITIDPSCLTSTVTSLATAIYQEREFDKLPILADALEDAGCTNQAVLGHLRGGGDHCRGCWPLDLILGKE